MPVRRAPLGPFPQPQDYRSTLPFTLPPRGDLYFYRGNFCGLHIADAPVVPGSNEKNPACVMAALLDNYPRGVQDEFLERYAGYYTHLQRSVGHALGYGHSLDAFIELSQRAQKAGLFADTWFIANEFPGFAFNQDASFWMPKLQPVIDALLAAKAIDLACPSWQMDQVMCDAPGNATLSIIAAVADALPRTIPVYTHWMNEAMAWWKTGGEVWADRYGSLNVMDRFTFWYACRPYLTGAHHQGNTTMARTDMKQYQDRLCDTLDPFYGDTGKGNMGQSLRHPDGPRPFALDAFESTGQDQFDGVCGEDVGDQVGFLTTCTSGKNGGHLMGYGNGGRMPDGSVL